MLSRFILFTLNLQTKEWVLLSHFHTHMSLYLVAMCGLPHCCPLTLLLTPLLLSLPDKQASVLPSSHAFIALFFLYFIRIISFLTIPLLVSRPTHSHNAFRCTLTYAHKRKHTIQIETNSVSGLFHSV